ncbi:unnamed protein product [Mytilus coruscus]|uniref:Uncharacterized protein n=1 Tax=Mytilus coruscus TaxID=42192 RepID=A0A6J8AIE3_MYTCO|nr:unnamed protein product [Mytilus coruscus]
MKDRTPARTSFLERQLSMDGEPNFSDDFNHLSLISEEKMLLSRDNNHHQVTDLSLPSQPILQRLPDTFDQNIPYNSSDEKLSTDSTAHRPARPSQLKYPNYETLQGRKDSYFDWPAYRSFLHPYDLSVCGLFFNSIFDNKELVQDSMTTLLETNNWHSITTDLFGYFHY